MGKATGVNWDTSLRKDTRPLLLTWRDGKKGRTLQLVRDCDFWEVVRMTLCGGRNRASSWGIFTALSNKHWREVVDAAVTGVCTSWLANRCYISFCEATAAKRNNQEIESCCTSACVIVTPGWMFTAFTTTDEQTGHFTPQWQLHRRHKKWIHVNGNNIKWNKIENILISTL